MATFIPLESPGNIFPAVGFSTTTGNLAATEAFLAVAAGAALVRVLGAVLFAGVEEFAFGDVGLVPVLFTAEAGSADFAGALVALFGFEAEDCFGVEELFFALLAIIDSSME
jgi:hypothetical protein